MRIRERGPGGSPRHALFWDPTTVSYVPNPRQLIGIDQYTYLLMPEGYNVEAFKTISDSAYSRFIARNILLLVLAGAVVASIVAYYAVSEWLTGIAYRVGINPFIFVISAAIVIAVAFGTMALQSYRAVRRNPAITVQYE